MEKFLENELGWLEKEQGEGRAKGERPVTPNLIEFRVWQRDRSHVSIQKVPRCYGRMRMDPGVRRLMTGTKTAS